MRWRATGFAKALGLWWLPARTLCILRVGEVKRGEISAMDSRIEPMKLGGSSTGKLPGRGNNFSPEERGNCSCVLAICPRSIYLAGVSFSWKTKSHGLANG